MTEDRVIGSYQEIEYLLLNNEIELHSKVKVRVLYYKKDEKAEQRIVETTPGRIILSSVFPKHHHLPFDLINKVLTSSDQNCSTGRLSSKKKSACCAGIERSTSKIAVVVRRSLQRFVRALFHGTSTCW